MPQLPKLNWLSPKIHSAVAGACGQGVFAKEDLAKDELLVVFGGHVMTMDEFYCLSPKLQDFPYQISEEPELVYGPAVVEEINDVGELFNHSCVPNAGFHGAIQLVAMHAIAAGEQITIDYALCMTSDFGNMNCHCGEPSCRKFITGDDWRIPELQERYKGYFQPYIEEKIARLGMTDVATHHSTSFGRAEAEA